MYIIACIYMLTEMIRYGKGKNDNAREGRDSGGRWKCLIGAGRGHCRAPSEGNVQRAD